MRMKEKKQPDPKSDCLHCGHKRTDHQRKEGECGHRTRDTNGVKWICTCSMYRFWDKKEGRVKTLLIPRPM